MTKRSPNTLRHPLGLGLLVISVMSLGPPGHAEGGLPGDINLDGAINVLDAQSAINMALGAVDPTVEADVDANQSVDVRDVQTLINTALGAAGLVQPVTGSLDTAAIPAGGAVFVVAVSTDGRTVEAPLDETGEFFINLAVGPSWSIGFVVSGDTGSTRAGTVAFPVLQGESGALPLPNISTGVPIDLGPLTPTLGAQAADDLRTLLAQAARPLDWSDYNGNGVPDLLEDLFVPLLDAVPGFTLELPEDLPLEDLMALLGPCLDTQWDVLSQPDLSGIEQGGVPRFVRPLFDCLESALVDWLEANTGWPQELVFLYSLLVEQGLVPEIRAWLEGLDRPEVYDADGNGVPDYIESMLCITGVAPPELVGVGMCTLDPDQDGVPNWLDADAWTADDLDGDGVPNAMDVDDDGDGVPDYADANPAEATVW